jgi:uncharacterized protein (DUF2141 family)
MGSCKDCVPVMQMGEIASNGTLETWMVTQLKTFLTSLFSKINLNGNADKPWFKDSGTWLRIVLGLAFVLYFGNVGRLFYIRHFVPHTGTLNLHITGLRPPGNLIINLKTDYYQNFSRKSIMRFDSSEMTYKVEKLYFGDYLIQVIHDENYNDTADTDSATGLFEEGFGVYNFEKVDMRTLADGKNGMPFENLKYTFDTNGKTIEIQIHYPPFPWQIR